MNNDDLIEIENPSENPSVFRSTPYEMLVRQSKKLGQVATHAIHDVKNILHKEVSMPSAEHLLGNFPHLSRTTDAKKEKELEEADKLKKLVKRSHQVLASSRTVFPMTLFPDSIVVDRSKMSIIKRNFFWSSNVISFQIEDVLNVSCSVGPLFGSLTIASRVMSSVDHFTINYLWRADAMFMKRLIQGHIIAKNNKLETDKLNRSEMVEMLCELGADSDG
jgi:hypothetical protein